MTASRHLIVGSAGGTNAFGTIKSVRDRYGDQVFVVALDTHPREHVAASTLADAFVRVPLARSPEFAAALHDLARTYPGSFYLPQHDEEIVAAAHLAAEGRLPSDLVLIAPPNDVVQICWDKWKTHWWLVARGLPSPVTALATEAEFARMPRPVLLKPREGTGGTNFRHIETTADLADIDPNRWLLQEVLQTPQVSVETFLSRSGQIFRTVCREYIEFKPGSPSMKARLHDDRALAEIAERLARELPLFGAFVFEVMRDRAGDWRIIDVNPRLGAGTRMCVSIGIDIAAASLADFWGEEVSKLLPPLVGEYYIARQYEEYVTSRPHPVPPGSGS